MPPLTAIITATWSIARRVEATLTDAGPAALSSAANP
jgi:hypothetical protein